MATKELVDVEKTATASRTKLAGHLIGLLERVRDDSLSDEQLRALQEGRNPFALPQSAEVDINDRVAWWRDHWSRFYGMNPDFSGLVIPNRQPGFDRLIIMAKGFKMKRWIEVASRMHGVYLCQNDLDGSVPTNDRDCAKRSYAIWIRDRQEADEELKNLSADQLAMRGVAGIALPERLVDGTAYVAENGRHMDEDNVTLCVGSRYSDGGVPRVSWDRDSRKVRVDWCYVDSASDGLRARAVVS